MWLGTRAQLQLEILVLRHRVNVLRRQRKMRPRLTSFDRAFWVWLYRLWPGCLAALVIVKPETVICWHREGFRRYWRPGLEAGTGDGNLARAAPDGRRSLSTFASSSGG